MEHYFSLIVEIIGGLGVIFGGIIAGTNFIKRTFKKIAEDANQPILEKLNKNDSATVVLLRNEIVSIYNSHRADKKFGKNEKENVFSLYEKYTEYGGNSYVHNLMDEMEKWEEE